MLRKAGEGGERERHFLKNIYQVQPLMHNFEHMELVAPPLIWDYGCMLLQINAVSLDVSAINSDKHCLTMSSAL